MPELPANRSLWRGVHVAFAACLGAYLYSSPADVPAAESVVRIVVFPGLAVSGLLLWRAPTLRRWVRRRRTGGER